MKERSESVEHLVGRRTLLFGMASLLIARTLPARRSAPLAGNAPTMPEEPLQEWAETSKAILRENLLGPRSSGRLTPGQVNAVAGAENVAVDGLMVRLLPIARRFSRPPISNFHVGAVALGASGALYLGANLEIPGNALNQTVHAEQSALANAFANQERGLEAIAVTDAPCGHCRQFLNEISDAGRIRIIVEGQKPRTLEELLPASFGPRDLGVTTGMLNSPSARMRLVSRAQGAMERAALEAASRAYAPNTKAGSGCAVLTRSRRVFAGSYLENAAFNPSLSPLQSALVNLIFAGEDPASIRRAVLVEMDGAAISQRAATEAVLRAVAPEARFERLLASGA